MVCDLVYKVEKIKHANTTKHVQWFMADLVQLAYPWKFRQSVKQTLDIRKIISIPKRFKAFFINFTQSDPQFLFAAF